MSYDISFHFIFCVKFTDNKIPDCPLLSISSYKKTISIYIYICEKGKYFNTLYPHFFNLIYSKLKILILIHKGKDSSYIKEKDI